MAELRENMFSYDAITSFLGSQMNPCRFKTSLCPDRCGHAQLVYRFKLDELKVTKNESSKNAKWVTPVKQGTEKMVSAQEIPQDQLSVAQSLTVGDRVQLCWNHDYVTIGGSSGPERPVTKLVLL